MREKDATATKIYEIIETLKGDNDISSFKLEEDYDFLIQTAEEDLYLYKAPCAEAVELMSKRYPDEVCVFFDKTSTRMLEESRKNHLRLFTEAPYEDEEAGTPMDYLNSFNILMTNIEIIGIKHPFDSLKILKRLYECDRCEAEANFGNLTISGIITSNPKDAVEMFLMIRDDVNIDILRDENVYEDFKIMEKEHHDEAVALLEKMIESNDNDTNTFTHLMGVAAEIAKTRPEEAIRLATSIAKQNYLYKSAMEDEYGDEDDYYDNNQFQNNHTRGVILAPKKPVTTAYFKLLKEAVLNSKEYAQEAYDTLQISLPKEKAKVHPDDLYVAKDLLKVLPIKELLEKNPHKLSDTLKICMNTKFLNKEEFDFVYNNFSSPDMQTKQFSLHQKSLNILLGRLDVEEGGNGDIGKNFRKDVEGCNLYNNNKDWIVPAAFNSTEVFGSWMPNYLKKTQKVLNTHDAVYWLPLIKDSEANKSLSNFLMANVVYTNNEAKTQARNTTDLGIISKNWNLLSADETKLKYKDILAICLSKKYSGQKYADFAVEAASWGVHEEDYKNFEKIYNASLSVPTPFDTTKSFNEENLSARFLPRDDARTGFFGCHTACCQQLEGVASACAISSMKDPYSQLLVIEKEGKIVAGSWVWENENNEVCFDNIEAKGDYKSSPLLNKIYSQVGDYLTKECNYSKVTIGKAYQSIDLSVFDNAEPIKLPKHYKGQYTDAREQVILAENKKAVQNDKNKESLRFVRPGYFEDIEEMQKVADVCFPDGDKTLQIEHDSQSLVAIDKFVGVVGYVIYDENEKTIDDMAVLPEYRKDKNATSSKLLHEMMKKTQELGGGQWSAELKDETSLRYMKAMAERGAINLEIGEVDHKMSDGSKVYSAKFSYISNEQRKRANDLRGKIAPKEVENNDNKQKTSNSINQALNDITDTQRL